MAVTSSKSSARFRVVAYRHPSHFGGMGVAAETFLPWLRELDTQVEEIVLSAPGRPLSKLEKLAPASIRHGLRLAAGACRRVLADKPDLCYFPIAQFGPALVRDVLLVFIYRVAGVRCLVHLHGSLLQRRFALPVKGLVFRALLPRRHWIVLSRAIAVSFPTGWSTTVIRNPLPEAVTSRPPERRRDGAPLRVGWLGLIRREKGVDLLLAACNEVPDVELTMAGEWGAMPRELGKATYLGHLDRPAALSFWSDQDVCLLPSRVREGLPMTILEALEAGVLVGATSSLGVRDLIDAGALAEIEPSETSIRALLESIVPEATMERRIGDQQVAWKALRHEFDRSFIRREFQQAVTSALAGARRWEALQ
jgi:glycosyltransferase involved in cell wall biosynthesis